MNKKATKPYKQTIADVKTVGLYGVLKDEVDRLMYAYEAPSYSSFYLNGERETSIDGYDSVKLCIEDLKEALEDNPMELFNIVNEAISESQAVNQALAHLNVRSRQNTEFCNDGSVFVSHADMMLLDITLMDALGFNEVRKCIIINERIKEYTNYAELKTKKEVAE